MRLWIVLYTHRHGVDTWPLFQDEAPSQEEMAEGIDFEPDREEYLELSGPFEVPEKQEAIRV